MRAVRPNEWVREAVIRRPFGAAGIRDAEPFQPDAHRLTLELQSWSRVAAAVLESKWLEMPRA